MSINNSHYGTNGVLLYNGEIILIYYDGVELSLDPNVNVPIMKGHKKGRIYLTSHRVVFVNKNQNDTFQSFSMPFNCMRNLDIEQPVFGANFIKGETRSEPYGRWDGLAKFKIWFNNGGAIEFGQCLMNAGRLASQARAAQQFVQQTASANANIYPAPPPAYTNLNPNAYGWVPMNRFPDRPEANTVYMYDQPPPYAGIYDDNSQHQHHAFDEKTKVNSGFVDPTDPNKVYVAATAPPPATTDEEPPAYSENMKKKN